jgi:hypothetical protein
MTGPQQQDDEIVVIHDPEPMALANIDRASIDMQISTARAYPRSVAKCLVEVESLALLDEETAESMFYALPRGRGSDKKFIEGPSVRLAELMAYSWGNLRVDSGIISEDARSITAQSTTFDLEKNVAVRVQVKRRITDSRGKRYGDDMIGVTSQAAISIALRNSVFRVVPRVYVDRIFDKARKVVLGEMGTFEMRRNKAIEYFTAKGITNEQIFEVLGIRGMDDFQGDQYLALKGLFTAIKTGETTLKDAFGDKKAAGGAASVNEALKSTPAPAAPVSAAPKVEEAPAAKKDETDDDILAFDKKIAEGTK